MKKTAALTTVLFFTLYASAQYVRHGIFKYVRCKKYQVGKINI